VLAGTLSLILAALIAAGAGVDVRTSAECPSAQGISERLQPLLPASPGATGERDVALVDVLDTRPDGTMDLMIRLLRPDASEIGNRRVSLGGSCQDVAEAVAAILAAWETDPRGEDAPADEPATPETKSEPAPEGTVTLVPSQASGWNVLVGAGAGVAVVGGVAGSGTVEALLGKDDSHWLLRAGLSAQTARTVDFAGGQAAWQHTSFAAGLVWRSLAPAWRLSLDAGPVLGWSTVSGSGFPAANQQQRVFEYGATAGLRVGRAWGRWTLWAETRAILWLQDEQAKVKGSDQAGDIPSVDATASLGMSLALFP
jgi:hypothetical protein